MPRRFPLAVTPRAQADPASSVSGSKKSALALLLALAVTLTVVLIRYPVAEWLLSLAGWARANPLKSMLLYLICYVAVTVLMAPGWILTVAAGYLYGWLAGTLLVSLASLLGAIAAFQVGRTLAHDWVAHKARDFPRFNALNKAIRSKGFTVVFLTRVSIVFPYNLLNYLYGLTHVRLAEYALATWLGMLPVIALYVFAGATAEDVVALARGEVDTGMAGIVLSLVAFAAVLTVVVVITRTATRILDEDLAREEAPPTAPE